MKKKQLLTDLTDEQCEKVVGGVGVGVGGGSTGFFGWGTNPKSAARPTGLINAGFTPPGVQFEPGESGLTVSIPAVPPGHL